MLAEFGIIVRLADDRRNCPGAIVRWGDGKGDYMDAINLVNKCVHLKHITAFRFSKHCYSKDGPGGAYLRGEVGLSRKPDNRRVNSDFGLEWDKIYREVEQKVLFEVVLNINDEGCPFCKEIPNVG